MLVVGLTGSIGMGKTTAAHFLRKLGVPVHSADAAVHALTAPGGAAVAAVAAAFPGSRKGDAIDRAVLRDRGPLRARPILATYARMP
jgi:dephospho-CoA kinase